MSWTQALAAWGIELGLSAPTAAALSVIAPASALVVGACLVLGGLEAWAAGMRRAAQ